MKKIFLLAITQYLLFSTAHTQIDKWTRLGDEYSNVNKRYDRLLPRQDAEKALKYYNKAIKINEYNAQAYSGRGFVYYYMKQYDLAHRDFEKAIRLWPTYSSPYFGKGMIYDEIHEFERAVESYEKVLELVGEKSYVYYAIGCTYEEMGDIENAIEYFTLAIDTDEDEAAYNARGNIYQKEKLHELAKKDFVKVVKFDSLYMYAHNGLGLSHFYLGEYEQAVIQYKICIRLEPSFTYAYNNLANCYFKMGNIPKACEYWNLALQHGYVYQPVWKEEYDIDDPAELIKIHCK